MMCRLNCYRETYSVIFQTFCEYNPGFRQLFGIFFVMMFRSIPSFMKNILTVITIIFPLVLLSISCSKGGGESDPISCSGPVKSFATDVNPIIQTFCNQAGCHQPGSVNGPGPLTNYSEVFNARSIIRVQIQAGLMPQNTTLSSAQKSAIICWIDNGALNN